MPIGISKTTKQGLLRPPQSASLVGTASISNARGKWTGESLLVNPGGNNYVTFRRGQSNLFRSPCNVDFGQGTVEFWFYKTSQPTTNSLIYHIQEVSTEIAIIASTNGNMSARCRFGATTYTTSTFNAVLNSWHHIAITLEDNFYLTLWGNGNKISTIGTGVAGDTLITSGGNWGQLGTATGVWYINDFRISKTVRYDRANSTYTTPSAQFVNDADTYCLFHLNGTDHNGTEVYDDVSETQTTPTEVNLVLQPAGNAKIDPTVTYFSGASINFDGTGDYLSVVSYDGRFQFGTGDFTVECWAQPRNSNADNGIFQFANNTSGFQNSSGGSIAAAFNNNNGGWAIYANGVHYGSGNPTLETWFHVALVRYNGTTKFYVNGTATITVTDDTTEYNFTSCVLGGYNNTSLVMQGYMQEFRVSNVARYTNNFSVPTARFNSGLANTKLLIKPAGDTNSGIFRNAAT